MANVTIYGTDTCAYCGAARMLLTKKGATIDDVLVHTDASKHDEMLERSGRTSVPQIFIGDRHIGGFDDLCALDKEGKLDQLLATSD